VPAVTYHAELAWLGPGDLARDGTHRGGRRTDHRSRHRPERGQRHPTRRVDPARIRQRPLTRVPPGFAWSCPGWPRHVLDLARRHVRGGVATRPGLLLRAGPGHVRRDGAGRHRVRRRVPLSAPRAGRRGVRRPERHGSGTSPGGPGRGHPDHAARHAVPHLHDGRAAAAGAADAVRRRRHRVVGDSRVRGEDRRPRTTRDGGPLRAGRTRAGVTGHG